MPLFAVIMMFIMGIIRKNTPAVKLKHIIVYVLLGGLILAIPGFSDLPVIFLILTGI